MLCASFESLFKRISVENKVVIGDGCNMMLHSSLIITRKSDKIVKQDEAGVKSA